MTITDKQVEAALSAANKASLYGEHFTTAEDCMRAALEAAEAVRGPVLPADERERFEALMQHGGLSVAMYGNVYMDERVQTARATWLKCHGICAAPSSAEQREVNRALDEAGDRGLQPPSPGAPEADERARFEAAIRDHISPVFQRSLLEAAWLGWQARAQSSAAPVSARDVGNYNEGSVTVPVKDLRDLLDGNLAAAQDAMPLAGDSIDFIEARGGAEADEATDRIAYHLFYSMFAADKLRALLPVVADRAMGGDQ